MPPKKEILRLKIAVIGSPSSGKSSFIRKIIDEHNFSLLPYEPTTEYQMSLYFQIHKKIQLEVQLWDCGSDHLKSHKYLRKAFFRNSSAALYLFDLNNKKWEEDAHSWIAQAYQQQCYLLYAIGTKEDLIACEQNQPLTQKLKNQSDSLDFILGNFFGKYEIKYFYQSLKYPIKPDILNLFVRMHDQYQHNSRSTLGRAMKFKQQISEDEWRLVEKEVEIEQKEKERYQQTLKKQEFDNLYDKKR